MRLILTLFLISLSSLSCKKRSNDSGILKQEEPSSIGNPAKTSYEEAVKICEKANDKNTCSQRSRCSWKEQSVQSYCQSRSSSAALCQQAASAGCNWYDSPQIDPRFRCSPRSMFCPSLSGDLLKCQQAGCSWHPDDSLYRCRQPLEKAIVSKSCVAYRCATLPLDKCESENNCHVQNGQCISINDRCAEFLTKDICTNTENIKNCVWNSADGICRSLDFF